MPLGLGFSPDEDPSQPPAPIVDDSVAVPPPASPVDSPKPALDPFGVDQPDPVLEASKSPLGAIGAVLLNFQRGMSGDKLYTDELKDRRQQREAMELKKLETGTEAMSRGLQLMKNVPSAQRGQVAQQYGKLFEHFLPGFTDTLIKASEQPQATAAQIAALGEHAAQLISIAGDVPGALKLSQNTEFMKQLDEQADRQNAPDIAQAFKRAVDVLKQTPGTNALLEQTAKNGWTLAELQDPKVQQGLGLTPSMVNTISRNKEVQSMLRPYGFIPQADADKQAEARAADKSPSQIAAEESARASAQESAKMIHYIDGNGTVKLAPQGQQDQMAAQGFQPLVTGRTDADLKAQAEARAEGKRAGEDKAPIDPYIARETGLPPETTLGDARAQGITGKIDTSTQRELQTVQTGVKNATDAISRMRALLKKNPDVNALGPQLTEAAQNLRADVTSTGKALGIDWLKNQDANFDQYIPQLKQAGIDSAEMQSLVLDLAYMSAVARGQHGQGLSDKDVAKFAKIVGTAQADPAQLLGVLDSVEERFDASYRNQFETAVGARPQSQLPDVRDAEALGVKAARGETIDPATIRSLSARQVAAMKSALKAELARTKAKP